MKILGDFSLIAQEVKFNEANMSIDILNVVDTIQSSQFPNTALIQVVSRFTVTDNTDAEQLIINYWVKKPDGTEEQVNGGENGADYVLNVTPGLKSQRSGNVLALNLAMPKPGLYTITSKHKGKTLTRIDLPVGKP